MPCYFDEQREEKSHNINHKLMKHIKNNIATVPFIFLGEKTLGIIKKLGRVVILFVKGLFFGFVPPIQFSKIIDQIYFIGAKSMLLICLIGAFTGMVLGLQGYYTLVKFGAEGMLGTAVALSIIRELGPVLTALMITGRAGSAMTAELGVMRNSEQIDALKTMDINPVRFLISPKIIASIISFPLLTAVFDVIGILGGFMTGSILLGIDTGTYFSSIELNLVISDIYGGFIKSIIFAFLVTAICCYYGYYTHKTGGGFGAKGVSQSTTYAVVTSSVFIMAGDYVLTSILL